MNPATGLMIGTGIALLLAGATKIFRRGDIQKSPRYIVAVGDSLTADGGYCSALQSLLPIGSVVTCHGWTGQGTKKINEGLTDAMLLQADDVIVLAGVNDLASGRGVTNTIEGLERIYQRGRRLGARIIAVELTPWSGHTKGLGQHWNTLEVNEWIGKSPSVEMTVSTDALGDASRYLLSEYDSGDGLHLNSEGQRRLGILIYQQAFGG